MIFKDIFNELYAEPVHRSYYEPATILIYYYDNVKGKVCSVALHNERCLIRFIDVVCRDAGVCWQDTLLLIDTEQTAQIEVTPQDLVEICKKIKEEL